MAPLLDIRALSFAIGGRPVLREVSVQVGPGEVVGLLGPNGSGKSTVLGLLSGRWMPAPGTVQVEGRPLEAVRRAFAARLGVVFQQPALDGKLTVRQNLELAAMLHALPRGEAGARVERGLVEADLVDRADTMVDALSGGMRRRLDVARALLSQPRLLLLDEPTTGLDEASFRALWDRLQVRIREEGVAVLVATHRPEEAERCDRLLLLHGGRVVREATPQALLAELEDDVIVLRGPDPEALQTRLGAVPGLRVERARDGVQVTCADGPARLPEILQLFSTGAVETAMLRRPGLSDVFARLTGHRLEGDSPGEEAA